MAKNIKPIDLNDHNPETPRWRVGWGQFTIGGALRSVGAYARHGKHWAELGVNPFRDWVATHPAESAEYDVEYDIGEYFDACVAALREQVVRLSPTARQIIVDVHLVTSEEISPLDE